MKNKIIDFFKALWKNFLNSKFVAFIKLHYLIIITYLLLVFAYIAIDENICPWGSFFVGINIFINIAVQGYKWFKNKPTIIEVTVKK